MKIGIEYGALVNGYEEKWGEEKGRELFKECGYSCVDYSLATTDGWAYNADEKEATERLVKEAEELRASGIEIGQVHGPWRYPPKDDTPQDRQERMEKMKRSIRMTAAMGCKRWVIHPIMPFGIDDVGTGNEEKTIEINFEFMKELLKVAKEEGVIICFENMPFINLSLSSPESIVDFVKKMDDDNFRMCLDTGHANIFPTPIDEVVKMAGDKLEALHVHDNDKKTDRHWLPFFGNMDFKAFGKALSEIGFAGVFSYETEVPEKITDEAYELMNRALVSIAKEITPKK